MHIDWVTLALQTINVLILVWLLSRFLYKPVMDAIAARQAAADKLLSDAQAEKDKAAGEATALKAETDGFEAEAQKRRAEMQASVEADRARLLAAAKAEAATAAEKADSAAAESRARLNAALEDKAGELAGRMAQTLLQRLPAAETTDAMFAALVGRLGSLPDDERRKLATDAPLHVVTSSPVDDGARDRYAQALHQALGASPALVFSADESLIAGFELQGSHIRVTNCFRADLDAMLRKLREGGDGGRA